ncbi:hypothetical protein LTS15_009811 [Exophiala xenobiotica]|nr:hypothetical protein LTS15_009811 [Exophiala xenobiotica]
MDVDASIHPDPAPNTHHRKIELQSPDDFIYLQRNLIASAQQKLDLHFPPSASQKYAESRAQPATVISLDGVKPAEPAQTSAPKDEEQEDPLRTRVRQLVDSFMSRTWEGASQSITVNGMDASTFPVLARATNNNMVASDETKPQEEREGVDFVYENYDTRLQAKVAGLYGELEALTAQVSKLRRTAPKQGAEQFRDALMAELADDEEQYAVEMAKLRERDEGSRDGKLKLKPLRDGWHEDVQAMYERGTGELAVLAGLPASESATGSGGTSLTETVGKVQRARTVAMEFE